MEPELTVEEEVEAPEVEPPTPSPKPRKKAAKTTQQPTPPAPTLDAEFWTSMVSTKREMDREATRTRYSNLVVFK